MPAKTRSTPEHRQQIRQNGKGGAQTGDKAENIRTLEIGKQEALRASTDKPPPESRITKVNDETLSNICFNRLIAFCKHGIFCCADVAEISNSTSPSLDTMYMPFTISKFATSPITLPA